MHAVLSQLTKEPIGIAHLRRSCPAWVRVMEYDGLPKNGSIQQVFGSKYKAVIVLYQMHDSKHRQQDGMGHYAVLVKLKKGVEYFSSYGGTPASEIAETHSDPKRLQRLLGRDYIVNRAKFQAKYHTLWQVGVRPGLACRSAPEIIPGVFQQKGTFGKS